MQLGPTGVFSFAFEQQPTDVVRDAIAELEELGYDAVWFPEARGKEAFTHAAVLLAASADIVVATGIASLWARDPLATVAAAKTLGDAYPGRLIVGLGVSHRGLVAARGHTYTSPLAAMERYLDEMHNAPYAAFQPTEEPAIVLAALGPRMLELAARRSSGAHTYFVSVEHTAFARERLGPDRLLAVEQAVVLETDPTAARTLARTHTSRYLALENYRNNLLRLGWADDQLSDGGSDELVDAVVAWGSDTAIAARVQAHRDAGADHVCVQVVVEDRADLSMDVLRHLAPVLMAS